MNKDYILLKAYFNQNLGDDLFVNIVANRYPNYRFLVYSPYDCDLPDNCYRYQNICYSFLEKLHAFLYRRNISCSLINWVYSRWLRHLVKNAVCCVYVIGSGFIQPKKGKLNKEFLDIFLSEKTYILGCNFGPFWSSAFFEKYYKAFERTADVCFRESYSQQLFAPLRLRHEADIAFCYHLGEVLPHGFSKKNYVVFSVIELRNSCENEEAVSAYKNFLAQCIIYWHKLGKEAVIASFCKNEGDLSVALEIETMVHDLDHSVDIEMCIYPECALKEMMGIFKNADLVIASRYHAMIIGLLYNRKVYPLIYSDKTAHVIEDILGQVPLARADDLQDMTPQFFFENFGLQLSSQQLDRCIESANRQFERLDNLLTNNSANRDGMK